MIFFWVFLTLFKILGIFSAYQANIPERFPPETTVTKIGFFVYRFTERIILIVNENLRFFPSVMVPLIQKVSVKIFFLKAPFLVADLIILAVVIYLFGRKKVNLFPILSLFLINPWIIFFFNSQRLSFKEKLYQFLFKPYKLSPQENQAIISILGILFFLLITIVYLKTLKKQKKKWLKITKKVLKSRLVRIIVILSLLFWITNNLGLFIKISSPERVRWGGYWIWGQTERKRENAYLIFEKEFTLFFSPKEGQVFSFCQDRYRLFLNEKFVGEGGLVSDNSFAYFEKWSVKDYLKKGLNTIRLECHNPYLSSLSLIAKEGGMIFQLETENGLFKKRVVSDSSWKVALDSRYQAKTEKVSRNIGFQQFFNANFDSFVWKKAQIIDRPPLVPWEKLVPRPIPLLQEDKVLPKEITDFGRFEENPKFPSPDLAIIIGNGFKTSKKSGKLKLPMISITEDKTYLLFDFGRMVVGYPEISLQTSGEATIDFGFAETLKSDGTPDVAKMVSQADQIITKDGNLSYRWFQRRAFRYAILIFKDFKPPVLLKQFLINTVNYPADDNESSFVSSDKLLNEIFLVAKYNVKIARQGNFEDCPHRERAQYVSDMRIVSLGNYYNYSDKRLIPKALWEFALSQRANGFVNAVYPSASDLILPDYSAQWISVAWEYYLYSGDLNFLKKLYPFLKRQMEGFLKDSDKDSLLRWQTGWWIFIDQGDQELNNDKSISLNLFFLETLKSMSKIAKAVGEAEEEKEFSVLAEKVKDSINQIAWNPQNHLYFDCLMDGNPCQSFSRQTNALALGQEIIPPKEINSVVKSILSDSNLPQIITPYFNSFVAESLFKNGFEREAINLLKSYWGGMIEHGATTFWESYDSQKGRESASFGESLAHGWSSGPAYLLPKWLLGIVPLEPGFSQFQIKPVFTGLSFVSGKIPVGEGTIEVSWERKTPIELNFSYNFPAKAVIILPQALGDSLFVNEKRVPAIISGGTISYLIETPGKYRLELR